VFLAHPLDLLAVAHHHARDLCQEAAVARRRSSVGTRRFAASLRRLADRLDPAPFATRTA
jgi:hypothetical protein